MSHIYPLIENSPAPARFPSPFDNQPHRLAALAAQDLQKRLRSLTLGLHDFHVQRGGKMLGVLVVKNESGRLGYLAGFSGMLGGQWTVAGFVAPVFDENAVVPLLEAGNREIRSMEAKADALRNSEVYQAAVENKKRCDSRFAGELAALSILHRERKACRHKKRHLYPNDTALLLALDNQSRDDKKQRQNLLRQMRELTDNANRSLQVWTQQLDEIRRQRQTLSARLQRKLFDAYTIYSVGANALPLRQLFPDELPPAGAGDCAAVKLLNAAIQRNLQPLCLAEFWWGADAGLRRHGRFYPSCRSKCRRIIPHMLQGLSVCLPSHEVVVDFPARSPETVFEDDSIVVVNKPAGMLSVPGDAIKDSVELRLRKRYPNTDNPNLLIHRLDQATSGLMIAARNARCYKALQQQFQCRTVDKTYLAELASISIPASGEITLPLRVDLEDRPRQMVCYSNGKSSLTRFSVIRVGRDSTTVKFKPVTGRTHQLRVHAAHPDGLNAPIVGDELYGDAAERLHLHAQKLSFTHPTSAKRMSFSIDAPFLPDNQPE